MNVMLLIPVTATPFVWTVMAPSHALASQVSQEMDLIAKVTISIFCDKLAIIVLLNQNVMLLISVTTILFVWTLMAPSHALAFRVSQEMGSTAKVINLYNYACINIIIVVELLYTGTLINCVIWE